VVEAVEGPTLDPSVNVYRIRARALRDGVDGWVTVAGNQGITFLAPSVGVFQTTREVALTADLEESDAMPAVAKTLQAGEVLEVLDWARTADGTAGITRIKAKVLGDSRTTGWVTLAEKDGTAYLEVFSMEDD